MRAPGALWPFVLLLYGARPTSFEARFGSGGWARVDVDAGTATFRFDLDWEALKREAEDLGHALNEACVEFYEPATKTFDIGLGYAAHEQWMVDARMPSYAFGSDCERFSVGDALRRSASSSLQGSGVVDVRLGPQESALAADSRLAGSSAPAIVFTCAGGRRRPAFCGRLFALRAPAQLIIIIKRATCKDDQRDNPTFRDRAGNSCAEWGPAVGNKCEADGSGGGCQAGSVYRSPECCILENREECSQNLDAWLGQPKCGDHIQGRPCLDFLNDSMCDLWYKGKCPMCFLRYTKKFDEFACKEVRRECPVACGECAPPKDLRVPQSNPAAVFRLRAEACLDYVRSTMEDLLQVEDSLSQQLWALSTAVKLVELDVQSLWAGLGRCHESCGADGWDWGGTDPSQDGKYELPGADAPHNFKFCSPMCVRLEDGGTEWVCPRSCAFVRWWGFFCPVPGNPTTPLGQLTPWAARGKQGCLADCAAAWLRAATIGPRYTMRTKAMFEEAEEMACEALPLADSCAACEAAGGAWHFNPSNADTACYNCCLLPGHRFECQPRGCSGTPKASYSCDITTRKELKKSSDQAKKSQRDAKTAVENARATKRPQAEIQKFAKAQKAALSDFKVKNSSFRKCLKYLAGR